MSTSGRLTMRAGQGDPARNDLVEAEAVIRDAGLLSSSDEAIYEVLEGGVSSRVVLVHGPRGRWVVKRALPKLRVADDWHSRVERSAVEARCVAVLHDLVPGCAPQLLAWDERRHAFVMECAPQGSQTWKALLMAGRIDPAIASAAGTLLGHIHARSARRSSLAEEFHDRSFFRELRIVPFLITSAERNPDLSARLEALAADQLAGRSVLVHGDYSPKNLLLTPDGGILLIDHEVAHWGNPTFDPAFVLTHLCLKALKFPGRGAGYLDCAHRLWSEYVERFDSSEPEALDRGVAHLLGGLLLARVDGRSPAEYLRTDAERTLVRRTGRDLVARPADSVSEVLARVSERARAVSSGDE